MKFVTQLPLFASIRHRFMAMKSIQRIKTRKQNKTSSEINDKVILAVEREGVYVRDTILIHAIAQSGADDFFFSQWEQHQRQQQRKKNTEIESNTQRSNNWMMWWNCLEIYDISILPLPSSTQCPWDVQIKRKTTTKWEKEKKIGKERKSLRRPQCPPASIRILVRLESEWLECERPRSNFVDSVKYYGICVKPNSRINSIFGARHARKKYLSFISVMHTYAQCRTHTHYRSPRTMETATTTTVCTQQTTERKNAQSNQQEEIKSCYVRQI